MKMWRREEEERKWEEERRIRFFSMGSTIVQCQNSPFSEIATSKDLEGF